MTSPRRAEPQGGGKVPVPVLVLLGCFGRGIEATGPNQSMIGLARALKDRFSFRIIAEAVPGDRDKEWQTVGGLPQFPLPKGVRGLRSLFDLLRREDYALLISNGLFDRQMTVPLLLLRRLRLVPQRPTIVAPRGEMSPGALGLKSRRKRVFLRAIRVLGLLRGVTLQATGPQEAEDIKRAMGRRARVQIIPNIRPLAPLPSHQPAGPATADPGPLRLVFASRIDRKKNLLFAFDRLAELGQPVVYDIYGPVGDKAHAAELRQRASSLPEGVTVRFCGVLAQADILGTLARYDLMFLPTLGENFGHAIADALLAGTPVLISDQTPWRGLTQVHAGWDLPLREPAAFVAALNGYGQLGHAERAVWRAGARAFVERQLDEADATQTAGEALTRLIELRDAR